MNSFGLTHKQSSAFKAIAGLDRKTIQNYKQVADATSSRRREDLDFSHHAEVAALPKHDQEELLAQAADEKLSVRQLREKVKAIKTPAEKTKDLETLQDINTELDVERELRDLASDLRKKYDREQIELLVKFLTK